MKMKEFIQKILAVFLIFTIITSPAFAKKNMKAVADVSDDFTIKHKDLPDEIVFKITETKSMPDSISIPEGSLVRLEIIRAQRELRWHKGGLILCKLKGYTPENSDTEIDVSNKDIYIAVRKYEKVNKKEATLLGVELVLAQGASFFAPGVDIGYFFIKGAIQRKKDSRWFHAGVKNAYDNSIMWFFEKGKPIELSDGDQVQIKDIKPKKAEKMVKKIDKRNERFERQAAKRIAKKEIKIAKRELKQEKKLTDCSVVEQTIENITVDRNVLAEIIKQEIIDKESAEVEAQSNIEEQSNIDDTVE